MAAANIPVERTDIASKEVNVLHMLNAAYPVPYKAVSFFMRGGVYLLRTKAFLLTRYHLHFRQNSGALTCAGEVYTLRVTLAKVMAWMHPRAWLATECTSKA